MYIQNSFNSSITPYWERLYTTPAWSWKWFNESDGRWPCMWAMSYKALRQVFDTDKKCLFASHKPCESTILFLSSQTSSLPFVTALIFKRERDTESLCSCAVSEVEGEVKGGVMESRAGERRFPVLFISSSWMPAASGTGRGDTFEDSSIYGSS